jgi:plasmid maintenance system antidote protein VapI
MNDNKLLLQLDFHQLIEAYEMAKKLKLSNEFLLILQNAIELRNLKNNQRR